MQLLSRKEWFIIAGLSILSFVPSLGGTLRVIDVTTDSSFSPENARLLENPFPIVVHIISSVLFCILGIFQFIPSIRHKNPKRHRILGRAFVYNGLVAAVTGLWMTHFYNFSPELQGKLIYTVRLTVGIATIVLILYAVKAAKTKNFKNHQANMIRAYALGQGAGMQVLTGIIWSLLFDEAKGFTRDVVMTSSWIINIIIAEFIIYEI